MEGFEALIFGFVFLLVAVPLLALLILVLAGARGGPDPTGRRPLALYLATVSFVALFTALIASTTLVASITEKIKDDESSDGFDFEEEFDEEFEDEFDLEDEFEGGFGSDGESDLTENDRVIQGVVRSGLVLGVAVLLLVFHLRRRRVLRDDPDAGDGTPAWLVDRSFVYVVCATAALVVLFAVSVGAYQIFQLAAPGVFASGDDTAARKEALQLLLTLAWLSLGALAIFRYFWVQAQPRDEAAVARK